MALRISLNKIAVLFRRDLRVLNKNHLIHVKCPPGFFRNLHAAADNVKLPHGTAENTSRKSKTESEETLYIAQNDPDAFGQTVVHRSENQVDPGDVKEENYVQNLPKKSQKLDLEGYARMIKTNLNENKIKEAIDVLEVRMHGDRMKPGKYIFNLLINGCAKAGYSKKAYQLYNKMKQSGIPVTGGTYTSLFNACANDPWPQVGLARANRLREIMLEKGHTPNAKNFNAMIKAYGRCGDLKTAFQLVDEMLEKDLAITTETFNFLMQACASDSEHGFRHALITWHKMLSKNLKPDLYSFNLMLRCTRDCSIGDVEAMKEVISRILGSENEVLESPDNSRYTLGAETEDTQKHSQIRNEHQEHILTTEVESEHTPCSGNDGRQVIIKHPNSVASMQAPAEVKELQTPVIVDAAPNLLCRNPHLGSLISIGEISGSADRFLLIGGISGFLSEMKKAGVTPGIETFTALLDVIPPTKAAEKQIISMIRRIGLKTDIDFFNILIKKRSMRFDYEGAKEVISMIKTAKLNPDIVTYGVLALGCRTEEHARELLNEMRAKEIRMNIQILGAMLKQGCCHTNFSYVHEIMQIALEERIKPNAAFLKHLDQFYKHNKKLLESRHPSTRSKTFRHNFNNFEEKLNVWKTELGIENLKLDDAIKKFTENPYRQLKEEERKGFEEIKNQKLARKQKFRTYIKRIKVNELKDDSVDSMHH